MHLLELRRKNDKLGGIYMYCTNCGNELPSNHRFCTKCGSQNPNYSSGYIRGNSYSKYERQCANEVKYHSIIQAHFNYVEKINMLYSVVATLESCESSKMQKVIELCMEDIKLAPLYKEYWIENAKICNFPETLPSYPSFQRLAIIYEKQKEYQKAIDVCNYAIQLGFYRDGTLGQMPGRLARLIKKARNENITIDEHSTIL